MFKVKADNIQTEFVENICQGPKEHYFLFHINVNSKHF